MSMIKCIIIIFITLNFISCNLNKNKPDISNGHLNQIDNNSYIANYLIANYSMTKGDVYTASNYLNNNIKNPKLLEIKFFTNLVSGKFENAYKISQTLKSSNKDYI